MNNRNIISTINSTKTNNNYQNKYISINANINTNNIKYTDTELVKANVSGVAVKSIVSIVTITIVINTNMNILKAFIACCI